MIKQCTTCSKDFKTYPALVKIGKGKYCSRKCSNITDNLQVSVKCAVCSKEFTTNQDRIKNGRGKFCSRPCYIQDWNTRVPGWNKGKSATWSIGNQHRKGIPNLNPSRKVGEENFMWKGGISLGDKRKDYFRHKANERRIRKLNSGGSHTQEEWKNLKEKYNFSCLKCKAKESEKVISIDHVIPLSKGGTDSIENIQPLCRSCNSQKNTKSTDYR